MPSNEHVADHMSYLLDLKSLLVLFIVLLLSLFASQTGSAKTCETFTPALLSMETVQIKFTETQKEMAVKLADSNKKRSAGFQRVCGETINALSIFFLFSKETRPNFHMRNVFAALDIAFIDVMGKIVSIQTMQPYVLGNLAQPTYSPSVPVIAALETYEGFFNEHGIEVGMTVSWNSH